MFSGFANTRNSGNARLKQLYDRRSKFTSLIDRYYKLHFSFAENDRRFERKGTPGDEPARDRRRD